MTTRNSLLKFLAIFFLAILPTNLLGQNNSSNGQFYPYLSPDVVVVDYRTLYLRSQFGIRVASEYQEAQLALRAESTYHTELFQDEEKVLAEKKSNLPASEFDLLVVDFDTRVETRRKLQDGKGVALSEWESQQRELFQANVSPIIFQVAQLFGTRMVLPRDVIIWFDETLDITPYVLAQANATFGDGTGLSEYRNPLEFAGIDE